MTFISSIPSFHLYMFSVSFPLSLFYSFLSSRNKKQSLTANAVATEQKATKVRSPTGMAEH